ncbi:MAG: glycosyltransferase family 4 protein [Bacteroidota bacterium]
MDNLNNKIFILYLATHPIQNNRPYRLLNSNSNISYLVSYLIKPSKVDIEDEENINHRAFDIDVVKGYNNLFFNNQWPFKFGPSFFKLFSFEVIKYVKKASVVVVYGHNNASFWIAMFAAKYYNKKIILTTDITYIEANSKSRGFMMKLKPAILRYLYNTWANGVFVPSTASQLFLKNVIKIDALKITITPYVVDEEYITALSNSTNIEFFRSQIGIANSTFVFIFCAKFIERKKPSDVIKAFSLFAKEKDVKLIMIGDGPLLKELKELSISEGLNDKIIFTGFVNYSKLPEYYTSSNCLVFCSEHEPFGLPVNESMLCGIPVIVSDRIGSRLDLVEENITGWVYTTGYIDELSAKMQYVSSLPKNELLQFSLNCKQKMKYWNSELNVKRQLDYFKKINIG